MPGEDTEPTFAEMEYSLRSSEGGPLYEHDVGFEEIKSSDNGQEAVGVRIFLVGDDYFYAPVFFNKGRIRGDELMWSKRDKLFVPFVEEWTRYILRDRGDSVGDQFDGEISVSEPDLSPMYEEPPVDVSNQRSNTVKAGSVRDVNQMAKKADEILDNGLGVDIGTVLDQAGPVEKLATAQMMLYSDKVAEALINRVPDLMDKLKHDETGTEKEAATGKKYKLTAKVVDQNLDKYEQPGGTGVYDLYVKDGDTKRMLVIKTRTNTAGIQPLDGSDVLVVDAEDGSAGGQKSHRLTAQRVNDRDEVWNEWWEDLSDATVRKNNDYVFVGPDPGDVTQIVEVMEKTTKPNGQVVLSVYYTPIDTSVAQSGTNEAVSSSPIRQIVITQSEGSITVDSGRMFIPKSYKAIKIKKAGREDYSPSRPLPAFATPDELLMQHGKPMRLSKTGSDYSIEYDGERRTVLGQENTKQVLQEEYGLTEKRANAMMHDFHRFDRDLFVVKQSQAMPPMPPVGGGGPAGAPPAGGAPAGPPMPPGPGGPPPGPPPGPGGEVTPPPGQLAPEAQQAIEDALKAESQGLKGPIEMAVFENMVSVSDNAEFIRQHLGNMLKSVDSVGTILFRIYADWDEFESDVGASELRDLVDSLKEIFINQGKTIIKLKEKLSGPEDLRMSLEI